MTSQNIKLLCQYNSNNDQLQIIRSQNLDSLDPNSKYTIEDAVGDIIGGMNTAIGSMIEGADGSSIFANGRAFLIEVGYDYATNLQQARERYGEQGYRDELTAIGKSLMSFMVGYGGAEVGTAIGAMAASNIYGRIGGAIIGGIVSSDLYNKYLEKPVDELFGNLISPKLTLDVNAEPKISVQSKDSNSSEYKTENFNVVPSQFFEFILEKYGLNTNLEDYSNTTPSFIVNDGNGNNFNMLALPDFSDLFGDARQNAESNFLNNFFADSLGLNYDINQFNDFLNENRLSFSDFASDFSNALGVETNSATFSQSFDQYFSNSLLNELGLNKNLFEINLNLENGEENFIGEIEAQNIDIPDYNVDYSENTESESITVNADDLAYFLAGNLDDYEAYDGDELFQEFSFQYERLIENDFNDLSFEQEQFVGNFNDDLQNFIAANPFDWQDKFSDFARDYENEWQEIIDNAISQIETDAGNLITDFESRNFYDPSSLEVVSYSGSLLANSDADWDFDPYFDGETFWGYGYYEKAQYWDPSYDSSYYTYDDWYADWDFNGDGFIDEDEYSQIDFDGITEYIREQIYDESGIDEDFIYDYLGGDFDYAEEFGFDADAYFDAEYVDEGSWDEFEKYVDEEYDMAQYWDIEAEIQFNRVYPNFSDLYFDLFNLANSWRLDMSSSWDPNDISFDANFNANFDFEQNKIVRNFSEFLFNYEYKPSLDPSVFTTYDVNNFNNADYKLIEVISASQAMNGSGGNEIITVTAISSEVNAGAGLDIINGGNGNDKINAGEGDDMLIGNGGDDILQGGLGNDIYIFNSINSGNDTIIDDDGAIMIDKKLLSGIALQEENSDRFILGDAVLSMEENNLKISYGINNSILIQDFENGKFNITLNHNPVIEAINTSLDANTEKLIDVLALEQDFENDSINIFSITQPQNGSAEIIDGKIKYTPHENFNGADSFKYLLGDNKGGFIVQNINIVINAVGSAASDVINLTDADETVAGNGGHDNFIFSDSFGNDVVTDFGGVSNFWNFGYDAPEHDTIRFSGAGLTADKMLLNYDGINTIINFEGKENISVTLRNFDFINLDNLPNGLNNILFDGKSLSYNYNLISNYSNQDRTLDTYDVVNDHSTNLAQIWNLNSVTFLNEIDNITNGLENSNDVINAMGGDDIIFGKSGDDILRGQEGNDSLVGGLGSDILNGGEGNDIFIYNNLDESTNTASDTILDFTQGQDKINLLALNLHFENFIITTDLDSTRLHLDISNFEIKLQGQIALVEQDFLF